MSAELAAATGWAFDGPVVEAVASLSTQTLESYRAKPSLVLEQYNIERAVNQAGYGRRQLYELVANGADALSEAGVKGRIEVVLTARYLYCANEGAPIDPDGVVALMGSHLSSKRGNEIGRFGVGFKSVLELSNRPDFFSRSGSLRFDVERSRRLIREIVPVADHTPILRIAEPLHPEQEALHDPELERLMRWATTVVRVPFEDRCPQWLEKHLDEFPAEFLLFSRHVRRLTLSSPEYSVQREIKLEKDGRYWILADGSDSARWRVLETTIQPSERAKADAGDLAARGEIPIAWAVPDGGRRKIGQLWAFFPTTEQTTLAGILNAPWKTNSDRQNVLQGEFNEEILEAAANMVASELKMLSPRDDPGRFLDVLPGREDEATGFPQLDLIRKVYDHVAAADFVPDQSGEFRSPDNVRIPPAQTPPEALKAWAMGKPPLNWAHSSLESNRDRASRFRRLLEKRGVRSATNSEWLSALREGDLAENSVAALRALRIVRDEGSRDAAERLISACPEIVLTSAGWRAPSAGEIFLPSPGDTNLEDLAIVNPGVAADDGAVQTLISLGVKPVDAHAKLRALIKSKGLSQLTKPEWDIVWAASGSMGPQDAMDILKTGASPSKPISHQVLARVIGGGFEPLHRALLPGPVLPGDGSGGPKATIDLDYHKESLAVLELAGATAVPKNGYGSIAESWYWLYRAAAMSELLDKVPAGGPKPNEAWLQFDAVDEGRNLIGPLEVSEFLEEAAQVAFWEVVLSEARDEAEWVLRHQTQDRYQSVITLPPSLWLMKRQGKISSSLGVRPLSEVIHPELKELESVLPVAKVRGALVDRLGLPTNLDQISEGIWSQGIARVKESLDADAAATLYPSACMFVACPSELVVHVGKQSRSVKAARVWVLQEDDVANCPEPNMPCLVVRKRKDAEALAQYWSLRRPTDQTELRADSAEAPVLLTELFPGIGEWGERVRSVRVVRCASIERLRFSELGTTSEERTEDFKDGTIYVTSQEPEQVLNLAEKYLELDIGSAEHWQLLMGGQLLAQKGKFESVRAETDLSHRLAKALGEERIRRRLPEILLRTMKEQGLSSEADFARWALSYFGVETLREYREELHEAGFPVPEQWTGRERAVEFVEALGFPAEFAGFSDRQLEEWIEVDGPIRLPELHDFQRKLVDRIQDTVFAGKTNRGFLSMPTGSGKTRVTVQSLVEMMYVEPLTGPVLWIAQSEELCEQAVQTWKDVWRGVGPGAQLRINRLWGSRQATPARPHQVIVATIQQLQVIMAKEEYLWLQQAACVIIDEAHRSVTSSYTDQLERLGLNRFHSRCPMIGLSATAFRANEQETKRLVARFGERLDYGIFDTDPYHQLQESGILARVRQKVLKGDRLVIEKSQMRGFEDSELLPAWALQQLAESQERNDQILHEIEGMPDDWPILVFAVSVDHAASLAAMLNERGIPAASVSAKTGIGARRLYIERFKAGEIRVLTNYNVLTTGFDAPKVRSLIIGRPTFSPVLYQQMIGRGLRGPLNQGTEECLIVNVEDNFEAFGEDLAFKQFEYLWKQEPSVEAKA